MVDFRTGAEAAEEASKSTQFAKTHYFSLSENENDPNNTAILRFLTEKTDWIVVDQHNSVPTRPAPADAKGNWPSKMGAVCRRDVALKAMYPDCFICDHLVNGTTIKKASARTWAYAVLREEVIENGQVVGIRDQTREVAKVDADGKATGEVYEEKAIVVVNMGFKNFFSALQGFANHYKTVLDRDYLIKRKGSGTDTIYSIIPLDPITTGDGTVFDLRNPQFADRYQPSQPLGEVVLERSSNDFYARFFDTRVPIPASNGTAASTQATATPAAAAAAAPAETPRPGGDMDPARVQALAERVKGYSAGTPAAAAPAAAAAAPAAAAAAAPTGMRDFS